MRQFPVVPIASFLIAVCLAALSPASRHLLRAAGETTGCTVTAVVTGKDSPDYQKEGKDNVRENGKDGLRKAFEQGFKKLKFPTNSDFAKGELDKTVNEAFDNSYDAITMSFSTFGITSITKTDNLWTVNAFFNEYTVVVLPKNADATLTNHEEGHKKIAELTVEYAKKTIKAAVEQAGCDEGAIKDAFKAAVAHALDVQQAADKDYDDKTEHGGKGGENGQLPAAAAAFAAAAGN